MVIFGMTNMKFVLKLRFFRNIIPGLIGMLIIFNLFINVIIINNQQKNLIIQIIQESDFHLNGSG